MRLPAGLPSVSPAAFRRLAFFAAVAMGLLVVSGAAVRLTDSGLGCDTWPRCTATSVVAPASFHGMVEFGNRVLSTVIGVYVGIVAVAALLRRPRLCPFRKPRAPGGCRPARSRSLRRSPPTSARH